MRKAKPLTDEEKAYIREHLPYKTYKQVGIELGRGLTTVRAFAKANGISNNKDAVHRRLSDNAKKLWQNHRESIRAAISKVVKEIWRKERMRENWGLERKTKHALKRMTKRQTSTKHYLKCNYGYLVHSGYRHDVDPFVFYYDAETRRTPNEDYFAKKYSFKFLPLDE